MHAPPSTLHVVSHKAPVAWPASFADTRSAPPPPAGRLLQVVWRRTGAGQPRGACELGCCLLPRPLPAVDLPKQEVQRRILGRKRDCLFQRFLGKRQLLGLHVELAQLLPRACVARGKADCRSLIVSRSNSARAPVTFKSSFDIALSSPVNVRPAFTFNPPVRKLPAASSKTLAAISVALFDCPYCSSPSRSQIRSHFKTESSGCRTDRMSRRAPDWRCWLRCKCR